MLKFKLEIRYAKFYLFVVLLCFPFFISLFGNICDLGKIYSVCLFVGKDSKVFTFGVDLGPSGCGIDKHGSSQLVDISR